MKNSHCQSIRGDRCNIHSSNYYTISICFFFQHGNTPLHEAAWRGYSRCVKALCTLPKVGPNGRDAAKKSKQIKCVIESTQNVLHSTLLSVRNAGGFSALHLAAQNGHNQSCREILLAGVDPDVQNNVSDEMIIFDQTFSVWPDNLFHIIFHCK